MKNSAKVGLGIGIAVAVIVIYLGLNAYAISNLQFRSYQTGEFDFADMSVDVQLEACNPTFFPASFNQFKVDITYKTTDFGTFTVWGETISPQSSSIVDGRMKLNAMAIGGLFLQALSHSFGGEKPDFDIDELKFKVLLDAPILGIIPFSITDEYSSYEFQNLLSGQAEKFDC